MTKQEPSWKQESGADAEGSSQIKGQMLREAAISGADAEGSGQAINQERSGTTQSNRDPTVYSDGCVELGGVAGNRRSILNIDQCLRWRDIAEVNGY